MNRDMFNLNTKKQLLKAALILSIITIVYNLAEGFISIYFGINDETIALMGFGVDSFVEVISGIGILHLVYRMKTKDVISHDDFEKAALKVTGFSFYLLTAGLVVGSILTIIDGRKPETTIVGIIISVISILTMYFLMKAKLYVGKKLDSDAIIADANCTKTCFYLSLVLLASSGLYEIFEIGYFDIIGSLVIAYFSFKEGEEAFEKAKSKNLSCCCSDNCNT